MIDSLTSLPVASAASAVEPRSTNETAEDVTIDDIIRNWGEADPHADLNDDGIVDVNDLLLLLEQQSSSNPVISAIADASAAAVEGLASLGGLLMESLGLQSKDDSDSDELPRTASSGTIDLEGLQPDDVDQAMRTAKGMLERWQSRGYTSSPPPGFEDIIDTLPLDRNIRAVVAKLIEASYSG